MPEKTNDWLKLSKFFNENGLEIEISDKVPKEKLEMWKIEEQNSGRILAAVSLEIRDGCFVLGDLAVAKDVRKTGYGKLLHDMMLEHAKDRGATEIWGCAKVPEYYYQYGWEEMDRETSPKISGCKECPQFNNTCFPSIIRKHL